LLVSTETARTFGAWLRDTMIHKGYEVDGPRAGGRTRLANESGVSLSIISRILNEGRVPEVPALRAIGNALGYTLGEMMVNAGIADEAEIRPPTARIADLRLTVPQAPNGGTGVHVEQTDGSHIHAGVTIETDVTMDEAVASLGDLSTEEAAIVATLRAMRYEPAEVAGAVLLIRGISAQRTEQRSTQRQA
jgi:transcriptional regulator with XRE-family HTH domain